jgi:hypothetical protein
VKLTLYWPAGVMTQDLSEIIGRKTGTKNPHVINMGEGGKGSIIST